MKKLIRTAGRDLLPDESGSTLPIMVILSFIMLLTLAGVFQLGAQDAGLAARNQESIQALFLADGGLSEGVSWLNAQDDPPPGISLIEPLGAAPDTLAGGTFQVTIQPDAGNPFRSRKIYTIASTGTSSSKSRTLMRDVSTRSFAHYIYFTDLESVGGGGSPIWFATSDYLTGPVHTNGHVHIMGDPYFGGRLTTAWGGPGDSDPSHNPSFVYHGGGSHHESSNPHNAPFDMPTFAAGYQLGAGHIEFPEYLDEIEALAQSDGVHLSGNYDVVFSRSVSSSPLYGFVSYRPTLGGSWVDVEISSFNGVLFVEGRVRVSGTLDGVMTLGSSGNMTIVDDVVYRGAHPVNGPNPGCNDILGLVSEGNIIVDNNGPNSNDCNIHAHMMALDTSFTVEDYRRGSPRGTLTVHGGIIQKYRGPVGTGRYQGGSVIVTSGYSKNYNYDPRFYDTQPPGYLATGSYQLLAWREVIGG